jgi:hypothetical protein
MTDVMLNNNAESRLGSSLSSGATTLSVASGEGTKFPSPSGGNWFPLTLISASGALEIVKCTARAVDVLTITRAQEGTAATAFSVGDRVELRLTALALSEKIQKGSTSVQVGQSTTASQNFNLRAPVDGTLRLSRGNAGAETSDPIKINSDDSVDFPGNVKSGVLGAGQTWQQPTRALGTTYTNSTGKAIALSMWGASNGTYLAFQLTVNGVAVLNGAISPNVVGGTCGIYNAIIPPGATYSIAINNGVGTLTDWRELR